MNGDVIIFRPGEIELESHLSNIGMESASKILYKDARNGMMVKYVRYPKGSVARTHTHCCGHGMYVLKGTLHTHAGELPAGSFVWFEEGCVMEHGAIEEDAECIFITNRHFDIDYLELRK